MHCRYIAKPGESSILLNNLTPRKTYKISVSLLFLHFGHFSNYIITNSYFATRFYLDKISEIMMRTFTRIDFRLKFLMIYSTVLLLWRLIAYSYFSRFYPHFGVVQMFQFIPNVPLLQDVGYFRLLHLSV